MEIKFALGLLVLVAAAVFSPRRIS